MAIPLKVNLRSLFVRRSSTLLTVTGVGLVVMVFVIVTSLANGLTSVFRTTGDSRNLLVLRAAARSELESGISRQAYSVITTLPEVDRGEDGEPIVSGEQFVVINQPRRDDSEKSANIVVRGAGAASFTMRPEVRLVEGRLFRPGVNELIASRSIASRFGGCGLGETLRMRGRDFTIVGLFDAGGTAWDSELWADVDILADTFNRRRGVSSVLLRCSDPAAQERLIEHLANDRRLNLKALRQTEYFEEQTSSAATLRMLAAILTVVLSIGACFSAANTMYAAVASRTREIGTLRALGFPRWGILVAYLAESVILSLIAGAVGVVLGGAVMWLFTGATGTSNFITFSEVAFSFRLTPGIAAAGMALSVLMGGVGGFLPARHAAGLPIILALREA